MSSFIYEQETVRQATGRAIRPGGLELTRQALTTAALGPGSRLLDVGCGAGATVDLCRTEFGLQTVGIDLSALLLAEGKALGSGPLARATALQLPFADGTFDAVSAECVLSLVANWDQAMAEVRRMLRKGGFFIISDVYAVAGNRSIPVDQPVHCCLSGARSRLELESKLSSHGFRLVFWVDQTPLLKAFAARLIWEHGSLAEFWDCTGATEKDQAAFPAKPGYFLALAWREL